MKTTKYLTQAAIIAALYVCLCLLQNLLLPNSASMAVQFRAAEALCVLALFTPAAIPGLALGCLLFNLTQARCPWTFSLAQRPAFWLLWGCTCCAMCAFGSSPFSPCACRRWSTDFWWAQS